MLLLYLAIAVAVPMISNNLHSIMLLLYLGSATQDIVMELHLHSIMLLLYPWETLVDWTASNIYIPLCFYFINYRQIPAYPQYEFTFHYASTLSLSDSQRTQLKHIYIPLCFYFIDKDGYIVYAKTHLHSIMLLLYRERESWSHIRQKNLHSIMLLLYPFVSASTVPETINLHSIMLLLYLFNPITSNIQIYIYIPLCFYFIAWRVCYRRLSVSKFTFHYASTLSAIQAQREKKAIHLHSIMLLLYQDCCCQTQRAIEFTFHYASTLSTSKWRPERAIKIYIPLCFYFIKHDKSLYLRVF